MPAGQYATYPEIIHLQGLRASTPSGAYAPRCQIRFRRAECFLDETAQRNQMLESFARLAAHGIADAFLCALETDAKDSRTLYAGAGKGLFRSTGAGGKWNRLGSGEENGLLQKITLNPQDPSQVLWL